MKDKILTQHSMKDTFSSLCLVNLFGAECSLIFFPLILCSTKRIDNSNSRLVSQVDKETGDYNYIHFRIFGLPVLSKSRYWLGENLQLQDFCNISQQFI